MSARRTGYTRGRDKRTRRSVKLQEAIARSLISVGGAGTIVAVCGVFLFLVWVVKDLFLPASVGEPQRLTAGVVGGEVLGFGVDEYRTIGWVLTADGVLRGIRLETGAELTRARVAPEGGPRVTAFAKEPDGRGFALGFSNGTVRVGRIDYATSFLEPDAVPVELRALPPGGMGVIGESIAERTVRGQYRVQRIVFELEEPVKFHRDASITAIHRAALGPNLLVAVIDAGGAVAVREMVAEEDPFTLGPRTISWRPPVLIPVSQGIGNPEFVRITDLASNLIVAWRSGVLERWAIRDLRNPRAAEALNVVDRPAELTALELMLGGVTVICGESGGRVTGWFVVPDPDNEIDGARLSKAHEFDLGDPSAVRAITTSNRDRIFAVGTASGRVHAMFMTSEKHLASVEVPSGRPVETVAIAPKGDALLAAGDGGIAMWPFDPRHPEATLGALFGRVWYERHQGPDHVWQSSAGTDEFEPKLSLVPLVFGTIKATFYSMLLAVPLALLAAIYTSEFMRSRTKARIKPVVEMMASLPSVVLGFLAAIVIAPAAEAAVPALMAALLTVPFVVVLAAFVWQSLPTRSTLRLDFLRLPLSGLAMVLGIALAFVVGPVVEDLLFTGDVRAWLAGAGGSGIGGWMILLLPCSGLAVAVFVSLVVNPWLRRVTEAMDRGAAGIAHLVKFLVAFAAFVVLALALSWVIYELPALFGGERFDLRDGVEIAGVDVSPFGTFDQRNALIVGFVMGFAIIPIIYTLAEDALASVPEHLRAASLGAGATPWQTAVRVIVPTATSGLFSACMVGLGRAVGETMIVLMAAGNTPLMSMNVFNGFRTLAANIATELPEAVRNSTHYRTLFLAALVLFAMTFVINTVAESVRSRFRRRAYQL